MEGSEKSSVIHQFEVNDENTQVIYENEEQENYVQEQPKLYENIPEVTYESTTTQLSFHEELNAVDLRITRSVSEISTSGEVFELYEGNKNRESTNNHVFNNHSLTDSLNNFSEAQLENLTKSSNDLSSGINRYNHSYENTPQNLCLSNQQNSYQHVFTLKENKFNNPNRLDAEKKFNLVLLVDQETQTQIKKSKEACVQTENYNNQLSFSFFKRKNLSNFNHYCLACKRFYSSKSSFDRHARSHLRKRTEKLTTNFNVGIKGKCQIAENVYNNQFNLFTSFQLSKFQCEICCKLFFNKESKDNHVRKFILQQFSLKKCQVCHEMFFTLGALNDHVNFVHAKHNYKCLSYCCIFCNESFESSYSFQLHLEDHLST